MITQEIWKEMLEPLLADVDSFSWVLPKDCPVSFSRDGTSLEQNLALRQELNRTWNTDNRRRIELAVWYVRAWGGVRRTGDQTITRYVEGFPNLPNRMSGISSWSKIATISDPAKYAIYDARVAFSLNAIQKLSIGSIIESFPVPPGQNATIEPAARSLGFERVRTRTMRKPYERYLEIIHSADGWTMQKTEMALFATAIKLATKLRQASRSN